MMLQLMMMMIKNYKTYPDFEALVDWTLIILILLAISCSISTFLASGEWYCSAILECRYNLKFYGNRISQHNLLVCTLAWNEWKEEQWGLLLNSMTLIDTSKSSYGHVIKIEEWACSYEVSLLQKIVVSLWDRTGEL